MTVTYLLASLVAASLMGGVSIAKDCKKYLYKCGISDKKPPSTESKHENAKIHLDVPRNPKPFLDQSDRRTEPVWVKPYK